MKSILFVLTLLIGPMALAEVIVPVRTIRAREIIASEDLAIKSAQVNGAVSNAADIIGQEARIVLYAGRPIRPGDVGPPALIGRNDLVTLIFISGPLRIATEGRALGRGAVGESIRAMNMTSRMTVTGVVLANGAVEVQ